jgi:[ribosomal protein S5]-alanine N-acetyltransferase
MIFETKRLLVAQWKAGDLEALYELFNDPAIKDSIVPQLTMEETTQIFKCQLNEYDSRFPFGRYFIIEKKSGNIIGLFLLKENKGEIEIGYSLKKEHWNQGYATEIVQGSIDWLLAINTFSKIYAVTETDNTSSQHVLLKSGFMQQENLIENGKEMSLFRLLLKVDR